MSLRARGQELLDPIVVVVLLLLGILQTTGTEGANDETVVDSFLIPLAVLPVLLRRRAPFAATVAVAVGIVVSGLPTFDQLRCGVVIPAALLVLYSLGARAERRRAWLGLGLVGGAMAFLIETDPALRAGPFLDAALFVYPLIAAAWGVGRVARANDLAAEELARRTEELTARREQSASLAVEVERTLLAADLDAAARTRLREIVDLAADAEQLTDEEPERANQLFGRIERYGRESLNEMRGLLGVLRSDERPAATPRPTLEEIDALIERARAGGRAVELEVSGERRPLPQSVELAAYRALQHALVAVADADAAPAVVALRYLPDALELEVRGHPTAGSEAGLAVMAARERVTAHGGRFSAPVPQSGLQVLRATLPIAPAHA